MHITIFLRLISFYLKISFDELKEILHPELANILKLSFAMQHGQIWWLIISSFSQKIFSTPPQPTESTEYYFVTTYIYKENPLLFKKQKNQRARIRIK